MGLHRVSLGYAQSYKGVMAMIKVLNREKKKPLIEPTKLSKHGKEESI